MMKDNVLTEADADKIINEVVYCYIQLDHAFLAEMREQ